MMLQSCIQSTRAERAADVGIVTRFKLKFTQLSNSKGLFRREVKDQDISAASGTIGWSFSLITKNVFSFFQKFL